MSNLIDKFDGVELSKTDMISKEDQEFCDLNFNFYSEVYKKYEIHLNTMDELEKDQKEFRSELEQRGINYPSTYIWAYDGISYENTKKAMVQLTTAFIGEICSCFEKRYHITTNSKAIKFDDYGREPKYVALEEILEKCVIGNLNGLSFVEKAIEEIKTKAKTERRYCEWQKEWNYDVKGKIIKFRFRINHIYPALYLYDNGGNEIIDCFTHNKIDNYRTYQNGNTDIKFFRSRYAMEFAKKYLGYTG